MAANILRKYAKSTDEERTHGMGWYKLANVTITEIANKYGVAAHLAFAVAAVVSPNNSWTGNLSDAEKIIRIFTNDRKAFDAMAQAFDAEESGYKPRGNAQAFKPLRLHTYPMCILKAYRILRDASTHHLTVISQKTFSFNDNIANEASELVTVDFHAYNIANKTAYTSKEAPSITKRVYDEISDAYTRAAQALGIRGYQLQAITWVSHRNEIDRALIVASESDEASNKGLAKAAVNRMKRERAAFKA
jgi:hypothetical protein